MGVNDTWLHSTIAVGGVDLEDLVHPMERQHHATVNRIGRTCQSGAGSTGDDRNLGHVCCLDSGDHLGRRCWHDQDRRFSCGFEHRTILAIGLDDVGIDLDGLGRKPLLQLV